MRIYSDLNLILKVLKELQQQLLSWLTSSREVGIADVSRDAGISAFFS